MLGFFLRWAFETALVHPFRVTATGIVNAAIPGILTTCLHRQVFGLAHLFRRAGDVAVCAPSQGDALIMVGLADFALPTMCISLALRQGFLLGSPLRHERSGITVGAARHGHSAPSRLPVRLDGLFFAASDRSTSLPAGIASADGEISIRASAFGLCLHRRQACERKQGRQNDRALLHAITSYSAAFAEPEAKTPMATTGRSASCVFSSLESMQVPHESRGSRK